MLLVYVLGIPIFILLLLHRNRGKIHAQLNKTKLIDSEQARVDKFKKSYSFLYQGYSYDAYWWEVSVLFRKVALSLVAVFFKFDMHIQGLAGLVIIFLCCLGHARWWPFESEDMNRMEFASLLTTATTFLCGQFTFTSFGYSSLETTAACAVAMTVNILYIFGSIWFFARLVREEIEEEGGVALERLRTFQQKMASTSDRFSRTLKGSRSGSSWDMNAITRTFSRSTDNNSLDMTKPPRRISDYKKPSSLTPKTQQKRGGLSMATQPNRRGDLLSSFPRSSSTAGPKSPSTSSTAPDSPSKSPNGPASGKFLRKSPSPPTALQLPSIQPPESIEMGAMKL